MFRYAVQEIVSQQQTANSKGESFVRHRARAGRIHTGGCQTADAHEYVLSSKFFLVLFAFHRLEPG